MTADPSGEGTLVLSTTTRGDDPDRDGYLITVDGVDSLFLPATGTVERRLSAGRHMLRLLGVAERCSVAPGDSLELDLPPEDTTSVDFTMQCPALLLPPGFVRISAATTGDAIPPDVRYGVRAEHFGAWDYGGPQQALGSLTANTLVAALVASTESGLDPYWYPFHLDIPGPCGTLEPQPAPTASAFIIVPADTLDVEFTVTCTSDSAW